MPRRADAPRRRDRHRTRHGAGPITKLPHDPRMVDLDGIDTWQRDRVDAQARPASYSAPDPLPSSQTDRLRVIFERLPAIERDVVEARYARGVTQLEIARMLDVSQQAVSYRIHRSFEKLAALVLLPPQLDVDAVAGLMSTYYDAEHRRLSAYWLLHAIDVGDEPTWPAWLSGPYRRAARSAARYERRTLVSAVLFGIARWREVGRVRSRRWRAMPEEPEVGENLKG